MFELSGKGLTAAGVETNADVIAEQHPAPFQVCNSAGNRSRRSQTLYFDLETCPDESRRHLFDLPEIPAPAEVAEADCLPAADILSGTIPDVGERLAGRMFPEKYLLDLLEHEQSQKKPRKGILDHIAAAQQVGANYEAALADQRKTMATTPEFCRIVALGWAIGNEDPKSMILADGVNDDDERTILRTFWQLVAKHSPLCGFNILNFDLPVIFVRSAILGVQPTKLLDLKPWGKDCIDLMALRFARGKAMKLKDLARLYGIDVPAGDCDGSQVSELLEAGKTEELARYVMSDVAVTRELHRFYRGYWCV